MIHKCCHCGAIYPCTHGFGCKKPFLGHCTYCREYILSVHDPAWMRTEVANENIKLAAQRLISAELWYQSIIPTQGKELIP